MFRCETITICLLGWRSNYIKAVRSWWKGRYVTCYLQYWSNENKSCMRVDESWQARVCMRVFSTLMSWSNENKSCMRVDESWQARVCMRVFSTVMLWLSVRASWWNLQYIFVDSFHVPLCACWRSWSCRRVISFWSITLLRCRWRHNAVYEGNQGYWFTTAWVSNTIVYTG